MVPTSGRDVGSLGTSEKAGSESGEKTPREGGRGVDREFQGVDGRTSRVRGGTRRDRPSTPGK